jgi:hypothetical protein
MKYFSKQEDFPLFPDVSREYAMIHAENILEDVESE